MFENKFQTFYVYKYTFFTIQKCSFAKCTWCHYKQHCYWLGKLHRSKHLTNTLIYGSFSNYWYKAGSTQLSRMALYAVTSQFTVTVTEPKPVPA